MRLGLPIRYKFLLVTTVLLVFCVVSFLFLASNIFKQDKIELVFDLNRGAVSGLSSDLDALLRSLTDKVTLVAVLSEKKQKTLLGDVLHNDSNIVFIASSYDFQNLSQTVFIDDEYADTYGISESYFSEYLTGKRPVPFGEIRSAGEAIWNATVQGGPPLIGFGRSVILEERGGGDEPQIPTSLVFVAFVRADRLMKSFGQSRLSEVFAVNKWGQTLIHPRNEALINAESFRDHPLFETAKSQSMRTGVASFKQGDAEMLGAFSATQNGEILVLSQMDGRLAFAAVTRLIEQSLLFAGIAVTLAFLAAIRFSRSLTKPIQILVRAMSKVSGGELGAKIEIDSKDEISLLAKSYNKMIDELKLSREQLEIANRDLERKVLDRTKKLEEQNIAVKKAQEALLQSSRLAAVGEVAGRAAHEVLNPLTSIVTRLEKVRARIQQRGIQEVRMAKDILEVWEADISQGGLDRLLENWKKPSEVHESQSLWEEDLDNMKHFGVSVSREFDELLQDTDFLLKESQRINKIVQNMRSLTRVKGNLRETSAKTLVHEAINVMADLCNGRQISIEERYLASDDTIRVDSDEFIQVATNLIRNSIQAIEAKEMSPGEKGKITITVQENNGEILIDIGDNGIGIRPEDKSKLFEIQFSTKSPEEGTGLGLSISRRFIRAFGGDIWLLESAPNQGSVFRMVLPLAGKGEMRTEKVAV